MSARRIGQLAAALLAGLTLAACGEAADSGGWGRAKPRMTDGKTLWEEKCRTVAGEKIFRKVENVEGVLLMKLRPQAGDAQWSNRDWPGAAFAREAYGDAYIETFLGYEHPLAVGDKLQPITQASRGTISTGRGTSSSLPGYRWVEVIDEKDGKRYRYSGRYDEPWKTDSSYSKSYVRFNLDKTPSPSPAPPRYGVTFEDHVIPEERYLGVASSTIKVFDLETKEVLGEMTRYAWSPGAPSRVNPSPWLTAYRCPDQAWTGADTRKFVDQILIPAKEK